MFKSFTISFFCILLSAFIIPTSLARDPDKETIMNADPDSVKTGEWKIYEPDAAAARAFDAVKNEIFSDEIVTVPKKYIYTLISFLILMAVIVQFPKHRARGNKILRKDKRNHESMITKNDSAFVSYVISLFDPHQFKLRTYNAAGDAGRKGQTPELVPDLEVAMIKDGSGFRFALETFYLQKRNGASVIVFSADQIDRYLDYQKRHGKELYVIMGIEGEPSFPKEVYFIQAMELQQGSITYQDLQPFRKFGMFSYHSSSGRLQ